MSLGDPRGWFDWNEPTPKFFQGQVDFIRAALADGRPFQYAPSRRGKSRYAELVNSRVLTAGTCAPYDASIFYSEPFAVDEWPTTFPATFKRKPFGWLPRPRRA